MKERYLIHSIADLQSFAETLLASIKSDTIVLLNGELGAGKTTLVQQCATLLKVKATITSPTFNLLNQYNALLRDEEIVLFHLDLYRLKGNDNVIDLDFNELSHSRAFLSFIEWPNKVNVDWSMFSKQLIDLQIAIRWPESDATPDIETLPREILVQQR